MTHTTMKTRLKKRISAITIAALAGVGITTMTAAPASAETDPINLTIVVVAPADQTAVANPWTNEDIIATVSDANEYWKSASNGKVEFQIAGDIQTVTTASTSQEDIAKFVQNVAIEQSFNVYAERSALVIFNPMDGYANHAGFGATNENRNGGYAMVTAYDQEEAGVTSNILKHELGHVLGLGHANRLMCQDGSADSTQNEDGSWVNQSCSVSAFDDVNDTMGVSTSEGNINSYFASSAGFAKDTDVLTVTPGVQTADYTILPWGDMGATTTKALKIDNGATPYYFELRQPVGLDSENAEGINSGVKIVKKLNNSNGTVVLDPTPNVTTSYKDGKQSWEIGDVFVNAEKTFGVKIKDIKDGSAVLSVTAITPEVYDAYMTSVSTSKKSLVGTLEANKTEYKGGATKLNVQARSADTEDDLTGEVTLYSGITEIGKGQLNESGKVSFLLSEDTPAGTHYYTLVHENPQFHTGLVIQQVQKTNSTLTVTPSAGNPVETTTDSTLKVNLGSDTSKLDGNVGVTLNGVEAPPVVITDGVGELKLGALPAGEYVYTFNYAGDVNTNAAETTLTFISAEPAEATLTAKPSKTNFKVGTVLPTIDVVASKTNNVGVQGTVIVTENGTQVGTGKLVDGKVSVELSEVTVGKHEYLVTLKDSTVPAATTELLVKEVDSAASLTVPEGPFLSTDQITVTASVLSADSAQLTGTVTIMEGAKSLSLAPVLGADGTVSVTLPPLSPGEHKLVASYSGNEKHAKAVSSVVTVLVN